MKKVLNANKDVSINDLILSYKTDQNFEVFYFFKNLRNTTDTITHEKLMRNDSINGIVVSEKQKGSNKIVCITHKLKEGVTNLKMISDNIKRVYLDDRNLNKLSYIKIFNYYTFEPNKNYLKGRNKLKSVPIKDPKELQFKESLYYTLNSFMSNNKENDSLIRDYENKQDRFDKTVANALSEDIVKKDENVFAEISRLAKNNKIIILNEGHYYPKHRLFAMQLLDVLKQNDFKYVSLETFNGNEGDNIGVFPNAKNGFYIKDPYFGHFVRKAYTMGFTILGHENTDRNIDREAGQAKNIMKIIEKDPNAKIFIYVGHGHLEEEGERRAMASYLKEYSKIDPITINQESLITKTNEKLVLLPRSVFAKDTLMKSSADYFLINNLEANLKSIYPNEVFKKVFLKNKKFRFFKNEELLVEVFSLEEYNKTRKADLLIPIESILAVPKRDEIALDLPLGNYYISVKSSNGQVFNFENLRSK
ncbi:hypothetical protein [Flavobacterium aquiphilum]|uniref:hypothetical protein n=1 Tax=Flavobacterium aquiphilum TaxID=3003261 RepID=UPI0024818518|nr:hypothetical protein [Flavobacterium aquiphilum]